jgi:hypothetical protein
MTGGAHFSAQVQGVGCPSWVKLGRTQCEHMFSALLSNSDIARCIPRGNDVEDDAIRPRSGRAARWLLRPSVRRRTCGLLRAPTRSQSAAAGSAAARRQARALYVLPAIAINLSGTARYLRFALCRQPQGTVTVCTGQPRHISP